MLWYVSHRCAVWQPELRKLIKHLLIRCKYRLRSLNIAAAAALPFVTQLSPSFVFHWGTCVACTGFSACCYRKE